MIQNSIFIHLNPKQTKADQPLENEAKIKKAEMEPKQKSVLCYILAINFIAYGQGL